VKIAYSFYKLEAKNNTLKSRNGALLKVHFKDGLVGYADCHPWIEFFDEPLDNQLELLKIGQTTKLTEKSLYFAELDAKARFKGINLFDDLEIPKSNYLITDLMSHNLSITIDNAIIEGFQTFKVKLGSNLNQELQLLKDHFPKNLRLRLDFNSKLNCKSFNIALEKIKNINLSLDYIEDPFPFDENAWEEIQTTDGLRLAADFHFEKAIGKPNAAKVLIVKPAILRQVVPKDQEVVVTSYLDHPFGQCTAAYAAAKYPNVTCGLLTHHLYKQNAFSDQLTLKGSEFKTPVGTGFGFDDLLRGLTWVNL
jgi:O-succinylbenzoate synthase